MLDFVSRPLRAARLLAGACLLGGASLAQAGVVTLDTDGMNHILAQAGIYLKVDPTATLYRSDLLAMDINEFYGTVTPRLAGAVSVFFIDSFVPDGQYIGSGTVGLGWVGAGGVAVVSSYMSSLAYSASLLAHELGHNLGLQHDTSSASDLMYPTLYPYAADLLTSAQIAIMQSSSLLQLDANGKRFLEIAPIAILAESAAPVPEPGVLGLMLAGLSGLAFWRRRRV